MSGGYCKLFEDIVTSTIWQTPNACRVLWVTMLALKDEMNICRATVPALAKICDITLDECQKYLDDFQSPDKFSRSQEYDGRRIAPVDGGWLILNGQKYRDMLRGQERRDYIRKKVAEHRERVNKSKHGNQCKPIAEAEAQAEAGTKTPEFVPKVSTIGNLCNEIWDHYPKKKGKKPALKKIAKAINSFGYDKILEMVKIIEEQWKNEPDKHYCTAASKWFGDEMFNEDPEGWKPHSPFKPNPRNIGLVTNAAEQGKKAAELIARKSMAKIQLELGGAQ